jgi:hypothetical protein
MRLFLLLAVMLSALVNPAQASDTILTNYRPNFEGFSQKVAALNLAEVNERDSLGSTRASSTYELIEIYFPPVFCEPNVKVTYLVGRNKRTSDLLLPMLLIDDWS